MIRARRRCLVAALLAPLAPLAPRAASAAASSATPGLRRDPWPRRRTTPHVALARLDGTAWTQADERGKPLLLNFWASWCEPCRDEMATLQQLAAELQPRGLQVLAVNYRESAATVARYMEQTALQLPVLRDAEGAAARALGIRIFPTTVALDRGGLALYSVVGQADWSVQPARGWAAALLA